jgi:NAD(P)-dependent dehydrogenase (short-subunit alcohol dehydrogenase family)
MLTFECDVTDEEQVKAVFRHLGDVYDGIDLLVNNASVILKGLLLSSKNTADMHHIMNLNVLALCVVTREAVKLMRQRPNERKDVGHIVNINSIFGHKIMATVVSGKRRREHAAFSSHAHLIKHFVVHFQPGTTPMNGLYPVSSSFFWVVIRVANFYSSLIFSLDDVSAIAGIKVSTERDK